MVILPYSAKNKLAASVIKGFQKTQVSLQTVRSVLYNKNYTMAQKLSSLYKIVPEEDKPIEIQAEEGAHELFEKIQNELFTVIL